MAHTHTAARIAFSNPEDEQGRRLYAYVVWEGDEDQNIPFDRAIPWLCKAFPEFAAYVDGLSVAGFEPASDEIWLSVDLPTASVKVDQ